MSTFPLFHDVDTRGNFLRSLENGRALQPGDTFRHVAALKLGLWYDFEGVAKDAAILFHAELVRWAASQHRSRVILSVKAVKPARIQHSRSFRAQLHLAIAPRMQEIDRALGQKFEEPYAVYTLPSDMDAFYRRVLSECLANMRDEARNGFEAEIASVTEAEKALEGDE